MKGRWLLADGSFYEGQFDHNLPKGKGIWSLPSANKISGTYTQTILPSEDEENPPISLRWKTS